MNGHFHGGHGHGHGHGGEALIDDQVLGDELFAADNIELTTVGIDVGTSTSHLMFSRLYLLRLGQFLSSRYVVAHREELYRSPILLTPYRPDNTIDADCLDRFFRRAYEEAGLKPEEIDTGAIILTGEAVKRTNAQAIAHLFAQESGKFVCASAGPRLEAMMAAHGSGAVACSRQERQTILNVDVGGGTSKLALVRDGEVLETAAINVGGQLLAMNNGGVISRIEPAILEVAKPMGIDVRLGGTIGIEDQRRLAGTLADCLIETIRGGQLSSLAERLLITPPLSKSVAFDAVTFSGGVSEYLYGREERDFGDLARSLADALQTRIAGGALPAAMQSSSERIRATVIGASQFTIQVSGNTIAVSKPEMLPIRNIQVAYPRLPNREDVRPVETRDAILDSFRRFDLEEGEAAVALAIDWDGTPHYPLLRQLAEGITLGMKRTIANRLPLVLVFTSDIGNLLGRILRDEIGVDTEVVSIDGVSLKEFDYIDIGEVIYPANAVPVVVKSLLFPEVQQTTAAILPAPEPGVRGIHHGTEVGG